MNKFIKNTFMIISFAIILQLLLFTPVSTKAAEQDFTGYIPISTKAELNNVRYNLDGNYYLVNDIVFTNDDFAVGGAFYNGGAGWSPIGTDILDFFTGTFDGNGHTISGLYSKLTSSADLYMGLFASNNGTIRNVGILNSTFTINVTGSNCDSLVGGIAGYNRGTIINCYNTGTVSATGHYSTANAGGIVGYNDGGTIAKCYNSGKVSATGNNADAYSGGITGENKAGNINNCYNTGTIYANTPDTYACVGGISGEMYNYSTIFNCYNTGYISASGHFSYVGGNVGYVENASLYNCYNVGLLYSRESTGGIVGGNDGSISNCYYLDIAVNGVGYEYDSGTSIGVEKLNLDQMSQKSSYSRLDFSNNWNLGNDPSYKFPTLKSLAHIENKINLLDFSGGNGTANNPYKISTKENLNNVRKYLAAFYELTSDITFSDSDFSVGGKYYNNGKCWSAISDYPNSFKGVIDGCGYTISELKCISNNDTDVFGLFGYNEGIIKNLGVTNGKIILNSSDEPTVGGIVACNYGTVSNCYFTGLINIVCDDYSCAGGIVGSNYGSIEACCNTGSISISSKSSSKDVYINSGGIAGENLYSMIYNCYNTGNVSAVASNSTEVYAGGIAGDTYGYYNKDTSKNKYSYILGCYNSGTISGNIAGGIVGENDKIYGIISGCYYYNGVSKGVGTGPSTGTKSLTFDQMKSKSSYVGFNFNTDWGISTSTPFLRGFPNTDLVPVSVKFNSNGGSEVKGKFVIYKTALPAPTNPTKLGYAFGGWYTAATGGTKIAFPKTITDPITMYAHWNVTNPSTPSSVKAVSTGYNSIIISWTAATNANQYKIYRGTTSTNINTLVGTVTGLSFTNNTGLTTNKTYYYKVVAVFTGTGKKSGYSKVASAKPIPATVALKSIVKKSTTSVTVTYSAVSGTTGYQIYYSTSATGAYSLAGTSYTTNFTKTKLTKGKTYYFKVRAYKTVGATKVYGNYSVVKSAKL